MAISSEIKIPRLLRSLGLAGFIVIQSHGAESQQALASQTDLETLGRALFFDPNLSQNRRLSCGTCHNPAQAFTDLRGNGVAGAASLGDDGHSLGDRNAPTLCYALMSPAFHKNTRGQYVGGQFHDGRAPTLSDQVTVPFTDPKEMGLANLSVLLSRIKENPNYITLLTSNFGESIFDRPEQTAKAIATSISVFEKTKTFSAFDSKYDRYLSGEYKMTKEETTGRLLFFSPLTNCTSCHLLHTSSVTEQETFTNYRYHNIGVPVNRALRVKNGLGNEYRDKGLFSQPNIDDPSLAGKFKVPTLRNIAVTAPYMHNGIFKNLRTAIFFYNQYTVRNSASHTNPETGEHWGLPESPETVDFDLLSEGQPIDDARADALIAFLKTLTDLRYESLLEKRVTP